MTLPTPMQPEEFFTAVLAAIGPPPRGNKSPSLEAEVPDWDHVKALNALADYMQPWVGHSGFAPCFSYAAFELWCRNRRSYDEFIDNVVSNLTPPQRGTVLKLSVPKK